FSAAQVDLLRLLIGRSTVLSPRQAPIEVGLPEVFAGREFSTVCLSLTRSHAHRACAFAESWRQWIVALTRARRRLILCGEPGALVRRAQFTGRLDQLDDADAAREAQLASDLRRCLQGQSKAIER